MIIRIKSFSLVFGSITDRDTEGKSKVQVSLIVIITRFILIVTDEMDDTFESSY